MGNLISSITGPRLFSLIDSNDLLITNYSPYLLESLPNKTISTVQFCIGVLKWTSLFWMPFVYKRYKSLDGLLSMGKLMCIIVTGYWSLFIIRGIGRFMNPIYTDFLSVLRKARKTTATEDMEQLNHYFFEFSHWPVTYDVKDHSSDNVMCSSPKRSSNVLFIFKPLCFILAHTIGIRMAFPGCTTILNTIVANQRLEKLILMKITHNIKSIKLRTADKNDIEAFYKDNRGSGQDNGGVLVICCEGNAGYAELGNSCVPLEKGFSVIGWNHPGFGGSTGLPFPEAEGHAIDAVVKYALDCLQFKITEIVLYGWSIGGYSASWAAMNYPDIRSLILDATFDNIDKLAENVLPMILNPLVMATVHEYIDLDVLGQMVKFNGPVRFIIRSHDEIIAVEPGVKTSNRGYFLLVEVLKRRYPDLITDATLKALWQFLGCSSYDSGLILSQSIDSKSCEDILRRSVKDADNLTTKYPLSMSYDLTEVEKTMLLLYITSKYTDEFDGTHCTELRSDYFKEAWSESDLRL